MDADWVTNLRPGPPGHAALRMPVARRHPTPDPRTMRHGHYESDVRNLHLHRVAFAKLAREPELLVAVLSRLDAAIIHEGDRGNTSVRREWRRLLTECSLDAAAEVVLQPDSGQLLRQCTPFAGVLSPRERWAALADVNRSLRAPRDP